MTVIETTRDTETLTLRIVAEFAAPPAREIGRAHV